MLENKKVYEVYKNMEKLLHNDLGYIPHISKASREAVKNSMRKTGLTAEEHSEAMQRIQGIYRQSATEEEFEKSIEALNK